jgi:hypothetical protein
MLFWVFGVLASCERRRCEPVYVTVTDGDVVLNRFARCASGLLIIPASTEPLFQVPGLLISWFSLRPFISSLGACVHVCVCGFSYTSCQVPRRGCEITAAGAYLNTPPYPPGGKNPFHSFCSYFCCCRIVSSVLLLGRPSIFFVLTCFFLACPISYFGLIFFLFFELRYVMERHSETLEDWTLRRRNC